MLCTKDAIITCLYAHLLTWQDTKESSISDDTVVYLNTLNGSQDGKVVPVFLF